jgi:DNA-binding transcriptional LysR family regulator
VKTRGRFRTDSITAATAAVLRGFGLGIAPLWQIKAAVDQGLLDIILEEFEAPGFPIHAVFPPTRMPVAKTRALVDVLAQRMEREQLG